MENISEHVRREREARGVTIEELAKGTFISVAVLKDIESGASVLERPATIAYQTTKMMATQTTTTKAYLKYLSK